MEKMLKKFVALIMALVLTVSLIPAVTFPSKALDFSSTQTLSGTVNETVNITGSNDENSPVVITVDGDVTLNYNIHIKSGYVKIVGGASGGTLLRGSTMTGNRVTPSDILSSLIIVEDGTLTLENVTLDGNKSNVTANSPLVTLSALGDSAKHPKLVLNSGAILQNNYNYNSNTDSIASFDNAKSGTTWLIAAGIGVLANYSTITINSGSVIRWNTSIGYGGAIGELYSGVTHIINMTGGEIYGNLSGARRSGATSAVQISSDGSLLSTFNMTGGKIYGNQGTCLSSTTTKTGAGIANDARANAVLNFSGSAEVTGNYWVNGIPDSEKGISSGYYDGSSYSGAAACNVFANATSYPKIASSFAGELGISYLTGAGVQFAVLNGSDAPALTTLTNDDRTGYCLMLQNSTELRWFVPVTGISAVPTAATTGVDLALFGTVVPAEATNQTITWSVDESNELSGASISGGKLVTTVSGTAKVLATITNGSSVSTDYTQVFSITVSPTPSVSLGEAALSDGKYYYGNAVVTGSGIRTIFIGFSDNVTSGDAITLPTAAGFEVSGTSNVYTKRVNLDEGTSTDAVRDYLRGVRFSIASARQAVSITVTTDSITTDTFYNKGTEHYYQFITYASGTTGTWTGAYTAAKIKSYMGRTGYLATVTSLDEDQFLYELSGGKTGWLGGTTLTPVSQNGNYYDSFNPGSNVDHWYWACGPEIGDTFYSAQTYSADAETASSSYYYNWGRGDEPNGGGDEQCLTTLLISPSNDGYSGITKGYQNTEFSWNNIAYNREYNADGRYFAKGYFVEYGDKGENDGWGDSGSGSDTFATASGELVDLTEVALTTVARTSVSAYTCDIDLPGSAKMVTISVDSGYFTVPSVGGGVLTFLGGTNGSSYLSAFDTTKQYDSIVFSFTDLSAAEDLLDDIIYTPGSTTAQTITATSSAVSSTGSDLYFEGHFYRFVSGAINWPGAVIAAGGTADPYFGGRGYIATATSQAENSILLRLTSSDFANDGYFDAYMGGLWQRNTGTAAAPNITRDNDDPKVTYEDIIAANTSHTMTSLLPDYSDKFNDFVDGNTSTYIKEKLKYYWIDGPEAGDEIEYNLAGGFSPWHSGEPNSGDFVYIGWQGAYWDDQSADVSAGDSVYATVNGYIVEFSGYGPGGSTAGIIKSDEKTVKAAYAITYNLDGGTNPGDAPAWYVCGTETALPTPAKADFIFGGWYTGSGLTGAAMTTIGATDTGAKEYWAKWTAVTSSDGDSPSRTITVTETSSDLFADNEGAVLAEANMNNAFSSSVEVKVTDTAQEGASFGFGIGTDVYPFDISLYIKGTNTKTEPASGYAVTISLPIPENLLNVREKLFVAHKSDDGIVTNLTSSLKQIDGIWYLVFKATEFSPYALVVSNLASYDAAAGLPYYLDDSGRKVFIGFAADGKYLAADDVTVLFAPNPKNFMDISTHWGKAYINFVTEREIFVGTGTDVFSPDMGMTRAMFATVIGRLYERSYSEISISDAHTFTDCNYDDYYGKYVDWAAKNGIIQGVGGGLFQPDRQVSRQEMAAMLYRFAEFIKLSTSTSTDATLKYSDVSSIASWAEDAALYCQETGIITGRSGESFAPTETATRAEVAAIIQRFVELTVN
ncbi:hypothetical protein SDC9_53731 [bioreactor metagenome]|uniref:SLH domain-containing protein n=1 Tax=bioreactor metagenome TaxID=1076179 RepID=A0A644WU19_9ZZZZ